MNAAFRRYLIVLLGAAMALAGLIILEVKAHGLYSRHVDPVFEAIFMPVILPGLYLALYWANKDLFPKGEGWSRQVAILGICLIALIFSIVVLLCAGLFFHQAIGGQSPFSQ